MANMESYQISSKKPTFTPPGGSLDYMYSSSASSHIAKTVDAARADVESVFSKLEKLVTDLNSIKRDFSNLANSWNKCVLIDKVDSTYVKSDEINSSIQDVQDSIETGKSVCVGFLDSCNSTISDINSFLETLTENYTEYKTLQTQLETALSNVVACTVSGDEAKKADYVLECNKISKEMDKYEEISDVTKYGEWVE